MNYRDYKKFAPKEIYHLYNRGVGKMDIFKDSQDLFVFLLRLKENIFPELIDQSKLSWLEKRRKLLPSHSFDLISYCLMPNHFHLLIQQKTDLSITKLISKICTSYAIYFNKKYNRVGAMFQDQFKAVLIKNNEQLLWTSFYIHKNPLEAKLVKSLNNYKWSSYSEYCNFKEDNGLCNKNIIFEQFNSPKSYLKYFKDKENNRISSFKDLYFDFDK